MRELLTTVAATGLLDVGVDETLGYVNGYGPPAGKVDLSSAVGLLAQSASSRRRPSRHSVP